MNLKLLIILIVVILIVLMGYLILSNKTMKDGFYFHGDINCTDIENRTVCLAHNDNCVVNELGDDNFECIDKCRFDPARATEANFATFNLVKEGEGDRVVYFYTNEEENGIFSECFNQCRAIDNIPDGEDGAILKSICSAGDCQEKCREYLSYRAEKISKADLKFKPYPTNRIEEVDFEKVKRTLMSQLESDQGGLKTNIQDTIFQDSINTEISSQVDVEEETTKLNHVISVLKNLNSTGNNFIQQVDQLGEFQDKYSQKIEELLEEKKNTDTNLDMKIDLLQNKLEKLNEYYNQFNSDVSSAQADRITKIYRSASCLANGITINLQPVVYQQDGENKIFRNGVYTITVTSRENGTPEPGIIFIEPLKTNDDGETVYCNPYGVGCSYKVTKNAPLRENDVDNSQAPDVSFIEQDENVVNTRYPNDDDDYSPVNYQFKKQAYFHVREIKTNDEYNSILINTPNGKNNLISNEQIKYPFFVIESLELPGYLINVSKNQDATGYVLNLKAANKGGTEKFKVTSNGHIEDGC